MDLTLLGPHECSAQCSYPIAAATETVETGAAAGDTDTLGCTPISTVKTTVT